MCVEAMCRPPSPAQQRRFASYSGKTQLRCMAAGLWRSVDLHWLQFDATGSVVVTALSMLCGDAGSGTLIAVSLSQLLPLAIPHTVQECRIFVRFAHA